MVGPSTNGSANETRNSETILLRVKRARQDDDLDQIYLEYDQHGVIKKSKMITESDSMQFAMSQFKLASEPEKTDAGAKEATLLEKAMGEEKLTPAFSLGTSAKAEESQAGIRTLKLQKIRLKELG